MRYCGWTIPAPPKTPGEIIVYWYFQGNHHSRVSERWCEVDFVHRKRPLAWSAKGTVPGSSKAFAEEGVLQGKERSQGEAVHVMSSMQVACRWMVSSFGFLLRHSRMSGCIIWAAFFEASERKLWTCQNKDPEMCQWLDFLGHGHWPGVL